MLHTCRSLHRWVATSLVLAGVGCGSNHAEQPQAADGRIYELKLESAKLDLPFDSETLAYQSTVGPEVSKVRIRGRSQPPTRIKFGFPTKSGAVDVSGAFVEEAELDFGRTVLKLTTYDGSKPSPPTILEYEVVVTKPVPEKYVTFVLDSPVDACQAPPLDFLPDCKEKDWCWAVPPSVEQLTLSPHLDDEQRNYVAQLRMQGESVCENQGGNLQCDGTKLAVPLKEGPNEFTITAEGSDGLTSREHKVWIYRAQPATLGTWALQAKEIPGVDLFQFDVASRDNRVEVAVDTTLPVEMTALGCTDEIPGEIHMQISKELAGGSCLMFDNLQYGGGLVFSGGVAHGTLELFATQTKPPYDKDGFPNACQAYKYTAEFEVVARWVR